MTQELKDKWIAALRSGTFEQGHGRLINQDGKYCCLGVLCVVAGIPIREDNTSSYTEIITNHLTEKEVEECWRRNDGVSIGGKDYKTHSFDEMVDYIEKNIEAK